MYSMHACLPTTFSHIIQTGSLATCGALVAASHYLRKGDRNQFQKALRWRVGLQGLTVVAAVVGTLYLGSGTPATKESEETTSTIGGIATSPGRPATVHQLGRAEERREAERQQLLQRLREAELREEQDQKRKAEEVLLRPGGEGLRTRPIIGRDGRDRTKADLDPALAPEKQV